MGHIEMEPDAGYVSAPMWAMARSNVPAGSMLAMRPRDLVNFARMHLEEGRAADGTRVLAEKTAARMHDREVDLPELGLTGTSSGLGFERFDTPAGTIIGHDVGTPGLCLALAAAALTGCGGTSNSNGKAEVVDGGTFTLGLSSDPGGLDPQMGAGTSLFTVTQFAHDPLVSVDGKTGEIQSALVKSWQVKGKSVTLTLADGITCSNGTRLTASAVSNSLDFVADPKNKSLFPGTFLPAGATAKGDDTTRVVTLTLARLARSSSEQWYNQRAGRVTSDPKVRKALTQALHLGQLQKVLTSGHGTAATTLAANDPVAGAERRGRDRAAGLVSGG